MFQKIFQLIIWKKTGLIGVIKIFPLDFNPIDTNDILDIHKCLMIRTQYKTTLWLIKKIFIELLIGIVRGMNHMKCVSFSNQKRDIQPTLINLHPNKYSQEFHLLLYYPFSVKLDDLLEVVMLWLIYLIKYVFQIKQKIWI